MPMINFTNPWTVLLTLVIFILVLLLGKETKKSFVVAIMLIVFLFMLMIHTVYYINAEQTAYETLNSIAITIAVDFVFILLSFFSYLWLDDVDAKANKKKSIDNSLEWFWTKV